MSQRRGFTLVEILATVAIVGLLVALLLPAVQGAREASRRTQCANNMRQLGIAILHSERSNSAFPAGIKSVRQDTTGRVARFSEPANQREPWSVMILPFLDDLPRFARFDIQSGFAGSFREAVSNKVAQFEPNAAFRCPSYPYASSQASNSNYMAVGGGGVDARGTPADQVWARSGAPECYDRVMFNNGLVFANSRISSGHVRDGLSNVYLVAETKYQMSPEGALAYSQISHPVYAQEYFSWATSLRAGNSQNDCCTSTSMILHAVDGINSSQLDPTKEWTVDVQTRVFGSHHAGGCFVAMADGSTHFLFEQIDINVYRRLANRSDGLPLGGFSP